MKMTLLKFSNPRIRLLSSKFCFILLMIIGGFRNSYAGTITSTATGGGWATPNTWIGGIVPAATDSVIIASGAIVTTGGNRTCAGMYVMGTINISVDNTTLTVNGGFGGKGTLVSSRNSRKLSVTGNWTFNGISTGSPTVTFNGTGNQTFTGILAGNGSFLVINKPSGTFTMNNTIKAGKFTLSAGIFDPQTFLLNVGGARTFVSGTLRVGAATWAGNYSGGIDQPAGTTIEYYANGNQTVNNTDYPGNLVLSGSGTKNFGNNIKIISGSLTLSGTVTTTTSVNTIIRTNLTIGAGSSFATGTNYTLTVTGKTSVSGTLTLGGTGAKTFTGAVTVNPGGTWTETGIAAINFANGISNAGVFTASTGVHTFQANTQVISGTFTIPLVTVTGITLTNNGSLTVLTTLAGTGGLTMGSNSSLVLTGASTITTLTANTNGSTVTYNGSAAQIIKATSYQDLVVNNSNVGGISLGGAVTVEGNMILSSGKVDILTYNLTVIGSITGASSTKYIKTSSTGRLVQVVTATPVVFPVGNSDYNPYIITNTGTSDSYGVRVLDVVSSPASPNPLLMVQRYWNVNEGVAGGSNLSMTAQWNTGEKGSSFTGVGVKYAYHNGTTWTEVASAQNGVNPFTAGGSYDISGTDITGGVTFAVGQGAGFLTAPTVAVSSLAAFGNLCINTTSPEKTYTVSGAQLTANIVITPPGGYEISTTSGSGFVANPGTLTLTQSGGYVNATTIYVRLKSTNVAPYNGIITHISSGSNSPNLAVTGAGVYNPPTVTTPTSANIGASVATLGGNLTDLGCASVTEEGIYFSTTSGFVPPGQGTKVSSTGTFGTGTFTIDVSGLSTSTTYFYKAFATNSIGTTYSAQAQFATTARSIYSIGSGNFKDIGVWSLTPGGVSCNCVPANNDAVFIEAGHTITVAANTVSMTSLNIEPGGTLTSIAGTSFDVSAKIINIDGTYIRNGTGNINITTMNVNSGGKYVHAVNNKDVPTANWNANSTLEVTGVTVNPLAGINQTFGNITWNCPGQTLASMTFPEKGITVSMTGNLTILSTGSGSLLFNQPALSVVAFSQSGGVFNLNNVNGSTKTLNVSGNYTHTGGTLQQSGGDGSTIGAIVFNGDSIQRFTSGGTLFGQINFRVNPGAIVDFGNSIISDGTSGSFTQLGTATIITKHPQGFSTAPSTGTIQCKGTKLFSSTGGFAYEGTEAQVTGNALTMSGMASLSINNDVGVTLSNAILINSGGEVNIGTNRANSILNDGGHAIGAADATLNMTSGTLRLGTSGIATIMPAFSLFNLDSGTTIEYTSDQPQSVDVNTRYQNLTFTGAGQKTVDSTTSNMLSVAGNLTTDGGLGYLGSSAVTVGGNIAGTGNITLTSGTINTQGNWTNTGNLTAGTSLITFDGPSSQIINSVTTTFNDLTLSNAGNKTMGAAITVNRTLDIGVNDTLSTENFTLTLKGDYFNSGTFVGGSSAIFITGTEPQSLDALSTTGNITVTKTAEAATLNDDMKAGSLIINGAGGTLNLGEVEVTLAGNLTVTNGTLDCKTSTVVFSGSLPQAISIPVATRFNNLTVNNTSGVTMGNGITVDGICSLTNGALSIRANTLTLNGTVTGPGSFVGGSTSSLVINGVSHLGTIRFTNNPNLESLTINRTLNGLVTLGSDVAIVSGGSLTLTEGVLDLVANSISVAVLINRTNGTMNGTQGTLVMNGKTAQTIPDLLFTSNTLANLTVNNTGGVELGGPLQLTGTFTPTAGTLTTRDYLTLISDANNTARIADGGCTTCSYITGNIKVQRYVPAVARRWRFIGSPITNATLADWKSETYITGMGGVENGFDATMSNQASVYGYNESLITGDLNTGWEQATNITNSLVVGKGYRVFIRGDRSDPGRLTGANATQNAVILDLVGPVNQGDIHMPVSFTASGIDANDGWCLLSNPYASAYDWNAHYDNGTLNSNVGPTIWVLSAQTGGYVSYNANSNAGSLTDGIIPAGAAFWVKTTGTSPTLTFKEQFKVGSAKLGVFKTNEGEEFSIKLAKDEITSDMLIVKYMDASTANYDSLYDIRKMAGTVNINAYGKDNIQLSLTVRPTVLAADTIKLSVSGSTGNYKLIFANSQELALHDNALLIDAYLNTVTDLKVTGEYPFSITGDTATQGLNRFYIVTGSNSTLPVKLLLFAARKADKQTVALNWSTAQETNNSHFEVQRSTDGNHFETIGMVSGNGTTSRVINYDFTDVSPEQTNYYRLKQVDYNGTFMYSDIRWVQMSEVSSGIKLYPVPANTELTVGYNQSIQRVRIYDITGKVVLEQSADQQELTLHLGAMETGVYILELTTVTGEVVKEKFVKD